MGNKVSEENIKNSDMILTIQTDKTGLLEVEKLDDCCATCRVLTVNSDNTYTATNSFFTINLDCLCIIRCLDDTFIEGV